LFSRILVNHASRTTTMPMQDDNKQLYDSLIAKINIQVDEGALLRSMGQILRSLLRRKGDAEFRLAVQDAFTDGILGRPIAEQRRLAHQVVALVIEKRPEIARAWQDLYGTGESAGPQRRASDLPAPAPRPAVVAPPPPPPAAPYEFASSEALVRDYVSGVLQQRLSLFQVKPAAFPSMAYCHEMPFFLFAPDFAPVLHAFVCGPLLEACRIGLERRVYRHAGRKVLADPAKRKAFLTDKRPEMWKIVIAKLSKLAAAQRNAEAKLALAAKTSEKEGEEAQYKIVMMPVRQPKTYRIFGIAFALGSEMATKRVKMRVKSPTELEKNEEYALAMMNRFRDIAAAHGLDLPSAADFQFLRTLFEFDAKRYIQAQKEFDALAGQKSTTRTYMFERLAFVDKNYTNHLSDLLVLKLFYDHADGHFGFQEIYDICVGTALSQSAVASQRPFVQSEVARRPRELAFQLRECLRRRLPREQVLAAAGMLLQTWDIMAKIRFRDDLGAALTVLGAFPLAFAGDDCELPFTAIGDIVRKALVARTLEADKCLAKIDEIYRTAMAPPAVAPIEAGPPANAAALPDAKVAARVA
jgi:hypothetical protein